METTNVVPLNAALATSKQELAERLLWTENEGRGWKPSPVTSSDLRSLEALESEFLERQRPTDRATIIAHLARLANYYGGDRTTQSWEMMFDDYALDLEGISEAHLRDIASLQRRTNKWFPRVAEITEAWNLMKYREAEQARRARVLLGREEPKPWERK